MGARELQALLREIKNVRSPVQRMKLMALAWRTVARLSPAERKELGSKLGVRGFEGILEKLGPGPKGIAPAEVLRALDGADDLDSSKLRGLVRGLRDPEQRKELLSQGLDFLDRSLDEEEPAEEAEETPEVEVDEAEPAEATFPEPDPEPVAVAVVEEVEVETLPEPEEPTVEPVEEPTPEPVDEPPEPAPVAEPRASAPSRPAPVFAAAPLAVPPSGPAEPPPEGIGFEPLGKPVAARASLVARFRTLRRTLDENGEADAAAIRASLSEFPEGWARRRAVMSFLRRGYPADLDDALALIEELERPIDRRWACAALIDSRELSEDDARRIAERIPFPSLARRLRRRFGSAVRGG